jgi:hypothetical protein
MEELFMIQQNRSEIESTCDVLLSFAVPELRQERLSLLSFVHHDLVNEVTGISTGSRFTQDSLSERLANAGLLPMFGFPTRQRFLFHEAPRALPAEGAVDRDLDIAISQFAPGSETVKDGVVHPPLGLWRTAALAIGYWKRPIPWGCRYPLAPVATAKQSTPDPLQGRTHAQSARGNPIIE